MVDVVRVVVGAELAETTEEVMQFLDRSGRAQVVATAADRDQLSQAVTQSEPDVIVAPVEMAEARSGRPFIALEPTVTVASLRRAMAMGAEGFVSWPDERDDLLRIVGSLGPSKVSAHSTAPGEPRAQIIGVGGARGGVGTTFVATHLADAFARAGRTTILVDADLPFADVRSALAAPDEARTIADLVPVIDELTDAHLEGVLTDHPRGFRVLHAPTAPDLIDDRLVPAAVDAAARLGQVVVVHLPRALPSAAQLGAIGIELFLSVLTLDVLAFHATRRAVSIWEQVCPVEFLVNRAARSEVAPHDVTRVFGRSPIAILPEERGVGAIQDRGRLLSSRSRSTRILGELVGRLGSGEEHAA